MGVADFRAFLGKSRVFGVFAKNYEKQFYFSLSQYENFYVAFIIRI